MKISKFGSIIVEITTFCLYYHSSSALAPSSSILYHLICSPSLVLNIELKHRPNQKCNEVFNVFLTFFISKQKNVKNAVFYKFFDVLPNYVKMWNQWLLFRNLPELNQFDRISFSLSGALNINRDIRSSQDTHIYGFLAHNDLFWHPANI